MFQNAGSMIEGAVAALEINLKRLLRGEATSLGEDFARTFGKECWRVPRT